METNVLQNFVHDLASSQYATIIVDGELNSDSSTIVVKTQDSNLATILVHNSEVPEITTTLFDNNNLKVYKSTGSIQAADIYFKKLKDDLEMLVDLNPKYYLERSLMKIFTKRTIPNFASKGPLNESSDTKKDTSKYSRRNI